MIYILLPVHNRITVTQGLIRCLKSQTLQDYRLILIDDGSKDGTEKMVRSEIKSVTVLKGEGNWWWGGSLHQGYLWIKSQDVSKSDLVLMLNDDTEFENDFLEKGIKILEGRSQTLLQAQCYSKQTGKLIDMGVHAEWKDLKFSLTMKPEEINCLSTRGLLMWVEAFLEIGGFYPKLLSHYGSDFEYTLRAHRKGMNLMTDPSFKLSVDEVTTGSFHLKENETLPAYFKSLFSRKYASNPVTLTVLIALACPWRWKFLNWARVWGTVLVQTTLRALSPLKKL